MTDMRPLIAGILKCRLQDLADTASLGETPGWDSFAQLRIMMALERSYGIAITDETIRKFSYLSAIEHLAREPANS